MTQGNETGVSSFDEWVKTKNGMVDTWVRGAKYGFEAGAASRQDEVSKLQTEIDELNFKLAEMKSRLNDAYTDGQTSMYKTKQVEIDELQKRINLALSAVWNDKCSHTIIDILKGESND